MHQNFCLNFKPLTKQKQEEKKVHQSLYADSKLVATAGLAIKEGTILPGTITKIGSSRSTGLMLSGELSTSCCGRFLCEHANTMSATAMRIIMTPIPVKRYGTGECHREDFAKELDETPAGVILLWDATRELH